MKEETKEKLKDITAYAGAQAIAAGAPILSVYPLRRQVDMPKMSFIEKLQASKMPILGVEPAIGPDLVLRKVIAEKPIAEALLSKGVEVHDSYKFLSGPFYSPVDKNIHARFKPGASEDMVRGVLGHEFGHALRDRAGKCNPRLYQIGKKVSGPLAALLMLYTARKDTSGTGALAATGLTAALAAPMLREEFMASLQGSKAIGLKGLKRLHSFRGLPSYALVTAAPGVAWGGRRLIEKVREKLHDRKSNKSAVKDSLDSFLDSLSKHRG